MFLNGDQIGEPGPRGEPTVDESFLVLLNGPEPVRFKMPDTKWAQSLELVFDTAIGYVRPAGSTEGVTFGSSDEIWLEGRSLVVLRKMT
jgi:glycogen operon protein